MGKTKGKNAKSGTFDIPNELFSDLITGSGTSLKAADGHNVDGWADEDIKTYNELLNERAKLEKEKNELEQKSSRHQTQRALLDENATALDSLFKPQLGGDFKFTGSTTCCLDAELDNACVGDSEGKDFPCKHEVCKRAKTKGVSWMEMDTIKYYHARIVAEKSQRMQKALRKQRDVELVRVKKDDDEELALRNRKNAILDKATRAGLDGSQSGKGDKGNPLDPSTLDMLASKDFLLDPRNSAILEAAKENEHIVRRIRARLDKIRHDVNAGRVSPADARVKLDQANSEMAEAERKNNEFRQMILDAEPALSHLQQPNPASLSNVLSKTLASSNADAFSQALTVMKGFFSASDPQDVQTAITDLRSVLELNGPMSPVLQKSFQALEELLAKPNAKGFTVDVTTADGKTRTCNNVVEVMMNLRMKMQGKDARSNTADPDLNLDEDTIKANQECVKVEEAAKSQMQKMAEKLVNDSDERLVSTLTRIKEKATLKSPIPPLSDIVLDGAISDIMFERAIKSLINDAKKGETQKQLSAKVTNLVIDTAKKKPEKFLLTLDLVKENIVTKPHAPRSLLDTLSQVEMQMIKFVAAQEEKKKKGTSTEKPIKDTAPKPAEENATQNPVEMEPNPLRWQTQDILPDGKAVWRSKDLLAGTRGPERAWESFENFFKLPLEARDPAYLRARFTSYYQVHLGEGLWEILRLFSKNFPANCLFEPWKAEKEFYCENMKLVSPHTEQFCEAIADYHRKGICPAQTAIVIAQRLTYQVRVAIAAAERNIKSIKDAYPFDTKSSDNGWHQIFGHIFLGIADLYNGLVEEISRWEPRDAPVMAMDVVGMVCTFSLRCLGKDSYNNVLMVENFISSVLVHYEKGKNLQIKEAIIRFSCVCRNQYHVCGSEHTCRSHIQALNKQKFEMRAKAYGYTTENTTQVEKSSLPSTKSDLETVRSGDPAIDDAIRYSLKAALHTLDLTTTLDPQNYPTDHKGKPLPKAVLVLRDMLLEDLIAFHESQHGGKQDPKKLYDQIISTTDELNEIYGITADTAKGKKETTMKSRFSEHLSDNTPPKSPSSQHEHVSLKHVSRKSPSINTSQFNQHKTASGAQRDLIPASRDIERLDTPKHSNSSEGTFSILTSSLKSSAQKQPTSSSTQTPLPSDGKPPSAMTSQTGRVIPPIEPSISSRADIPPSASTIRTAATTFTTPTTTPAHTEIMSDTNPKLTEREEIIKQQLTKFIDGWLKIDADAEVMPESVHKDVFTGVSKQLRTMVVGHVEMAWMIAKAQDYKGLQAWLKKNPMVDLKDDDGDDEDEDKKTTVKKE